MVMVMIMAMVMAMALVMVIFLGYGYGYSFGYGFGYGYGSGYGYGYGYGYGEGCGFEENTFSCWVRWWRSSSRVNARAQSIPHIDAPQFPSFVACEHPRRKFCSNVKKQHENTMKIGDVTSVSPMKTLPE